MQGDGSTRAWDRSRGRRTRSRAWPTIGPPDRNSECSATSLNETVLGHADEPDRAARPQLEVGCRAFHHLRRVIDHPLPHLDRCHGHGASRHVRRAAAGRLPVVRRHIAVLLRIADALDRRPARRRTSAPSPCPRPGRGRRIRSRARPSRRCGAARAAAVPIRPEMCDIAAKPTPRREPSRGGSAGAARCASRTRVSASRSTQEGTGWPPNAVSFGRIALCSRSSHGSRPSFAARSSSCDSPAKVACGLPKPRKEPARSLFVYTTLPCARTLGMR